MIGVYVREQGGLHFLRLDMCRWVWPGLPRRQAAVGSAAGVSIFGFFGEDGDAVDAGARGFESGDLVLV